MSIFSKTKALIEKSTRVKKFQRSILHINTHFQENWLIIRIFNFFAKSKTSNLTNFLTK